VPRGTAGSKSGDVGGTGSGPVTGP
jgi:hypothetical protein